MKVLCSKNNYLLLKFESEDGSPALYAFHSAEFFNKHPENIVKGTKEETLKSCRAALKHCKGKIKKYSYRDIPAILEFLDEQKSALTAFISILKGSK